MHQGESLSHTFIIVYFEVFYYARLEDVYAFFKCVECSAFAMCDVGRPRKGGFSVLISEKNGNVRIDYSGSLDISGLTSFSVGTVEEHSIRAAAPFPGNPYTALINLYGTLVLAFSNPFSSGPNLFFSSTALSRINASAFGGSAIHLPSVSIAQNATLRLDPKDIVGNLWTGSGFMQWNNTTLSAMNFDASPKTWVLNNAAANKITMALVPVPEPSSAVLLLAGLVGLMGLCRAKVA